MNAFRLIGISVVIAASCVVSSQPTMASPFVNGGFETGPIVAAIGFTTVSAGDTSISGWTVTGDSVDYIGSYWQPQSGTHSIDLSGDAPGAISQTFDTAIGQQYQLSFWIAGNPDSSANKTGSLQVSAGPASLFFPFAQAGNTKSSMGWLEYTYAFVADALSTTLKFASTTGTPFGLALDNVSVSAVPIPPALLLFATAMAGAAAFGRRRAKRNATV